MKQKKSRLRPLRSKNYVCRLKSFKLTFGSNRKDFLTPAALVFRLTGRGPGTGAKVIGLCDDTLFKEV
jgi:hypothetical protein